MKWYEKLKIESTQSNISDAIKICAVYDYVNCLPFEPELAKPGDIFEYKPSQYDSPVYICEIINGTHNLNTNFYNFNVKILNVIFT